jgi:hypothetical protein
MRYLCSALVLGILACLATLYRLPAGAADDEKNWGTLKGRIVFSGDKLPVPEELKVDKDPMHCLAKGKLLSEEWVVNKDSKGLRWVLVWLAPEPNAAGEKKPLAIHPSLKEIKEKEVVIDQPCCAFVPHVLAMREGQDLVAKNSAPISHNFHIVTDPRVNQEQNILIAAGGSHAFKGLRPQRLPIKVKCDIHGWMSGHVGVFAHPYFAVTDADGNFEIKLIPAGACRMVLFKDGWYGGSEANAGRRVTVQGGGTTDLGKFEWK